MNEIELKLIVRTPREAVLEQIVSSIRVPTESGDVGLRPRMEPLVLAVEPGLALVRRGDTFEFVGTAGGLLRCDGTTATLLTPLAVAGDDEDSVVDAIEDALAQPSVELEARATLGRLQNSILHELRVSGKESTGRVEVMR